MEYDSESEEYSDEDIVVSPGDDENLQELLSMVPKPVAGSSFSDIPLANEAGKAQVPRPPTPEPEKPIQPVILKPVVREVQMNQERVKAIVAEEAKAGRKRMENDNAEQFKAQKQFTKMADKVLSEEDSESEHLAFILNGYKKLYKDKINYNFRSRYTPSIGLANLRAEKKEVDVLLQVTNLPTMMGDGVKRFSQLVEAFSIKWNSPYFNATGFANDVNVAVNAGHFQMEFEQLALELAAYFVRPPAERAAMKWAYILINRLSENSPGMNRPRSERVAPTTVDEKLVNQVADL